MFPLLYLMKNLNKRYHRITLLAPTNKACNILSDISGKKKDHIICNTIHRFFKSERVISDLGEITYSFDDIPKLYKNTFLSF